MINEKISILISNFNKEKFLDKCIQSCLEQDDNNLEIIIIDNLSTDNSLNIIKKYSDKLLVKTKKKESLYSPKNQTDSLIEAFKLSSGNLILLLDSDDYILSNKASKIRDIFFNNKELAIIFDVPNILVDGNYKPFRIKKKNNDKIWPTIIPTSGISFKRTFFAHCLKSNLFDDYPSLEIDFRLNFFAQKILNNFIIVNEDLTIYRKVNDGIMSNIKKFSYNWWLKRLNAHYFINKFYNKNKMLYNNNYDFYLTKSVVFLLNKVIK